MRFGFTLILWGALAAPLFAPAVSKIGGGSIYNEHLRYSAQLPRVFFQHRVFEEEDVVQLRGPVVPHRSRLVSQRIEISPLSRWLPKLDPSLTREEFASRFQPPWQSVQMADPCIIGFFWQSESSLNVALSWGQGRGVYLVGQNTQDVGQALQEFLRSLHLDEDGCGW